MHYTQYGIDFAVFCGYVVAVWATSYYVWKGVRWVFAPRVKRRGATRVRC